MEVKFMTDIEIKEQICDIGHRLWTLGFVAANDGNITVKISNDEFFTTPTGVSKSFLKPDMIIRLNSKAEVLEGGENGLKPSSEILMHFRVYKERNDVGAVIHAHPPTATAFAVAHVPLDKYILPEAILHIGDVPIAKYGTPSTSELAESIVPYLTDHDAILLENHGAVTVGADLISAYYRMETLEFNAKIMFLSKQIGAQYEIADDKLEELDQMRKRMNASGRHPGIKR
jgi:L-fuculose-phosphate aldolase